jgi:hypothetical protein
LPARRKAGEPKDGRCGGSASPGGGFSVFLQEAYAACASRCGKSFCRGGHQALAALRGSPTARARDLRDQILERAPSSGAEAEHHAAVRQRDHHEIAVLALQRAKEAQRRELKREQDPEKRQSLWAGR